MCITSRFNLRTAFMISAATIVAAATPALADTSFDAPLSVTVEYSDLNLANSAGISQLYGRIRTAANRVCQPFARKAPFTSQAMDACIDKAMSHAIVDVHQPALTALHAEKVGKTQSTRLAQLN